jgi:hypothetical protein
MKEKEIAPQSGKQLPAVIEEIAPQSGFSKKLHHKVVNVARTITN